MRTPLSSRDNQVPCVMARATHDSVQTASGTKVKSPWRWMEASPGIRTDTTRSRDWTSEVHLGVLEVFRRVCLASIETATSFSKMLVQKTMQWQLLGVTGYINGSLLSTDSPGPRTDMAHAGRPDRCSSLDCRIKHCIWDAAMRFQGRPSRGGLGHSESVGGIP